MDTIKERGQRFAELVSLEIRGAISSRGLSVTQVAQAIEIERATLSRYFNLKREIPISVAEAICAHVGIQLGEIVDRAYQRLTDELGPYGAALATPASAASADLLDEHFSVDPRTIPGVIVGGEPVGERLEISS